MMMRAATRWGWAMNDDELHEVKQDLFDCMCFHTDVAVAFSRFYRIVCCYVEIVDGTIYD